MDKITARFKHKVSGETCTMTTGNGSVWVRQAEVPEVMDEEGNPSERTFRAEAIVPYEVLIAAYVPTDPESATAMKSALGAIVDKHRAQIKKIEDYLLTF